MTRNTPISAKATGKGMTARELDAFVQDYHRAKSTGDETIRAMTTIGGKLKSISVEITTTTDEDTQ